MNERALLAISKANARRFTKPGGHMDDLTKLTAEELLDIPYDDQGKLAEIRHRLARLEKCEELCRHRLARLEKCEELCKYAQHHPSCEFLDSAIGKPCDCGYNAARAAFRTA